MDISIWFFINLSVLSEQSSHGTFPSSCLHQKSVQPLPQETQSSLNLRKKHPSHQLNSLHSSMKPDSPQVSSTSSPVTVSPLARQLRNTWIFVKFPSPVAFEPVV